MNAVTVDLERMLLELSDSEKQRAFLLLARSLFPQEFTEGLTPIHVRNEEDELIGYYVSFPEINPEDFPVLAPEIEAEIARRTVEPGETIPIEEFFSSFTSRSPDARDGRKRSQRK